MDTQFSVYRYALDSAAQRDRALSDLGDVSQLSPDQITDSVRFTTRVEGMLYWCRTVERLLVELSPASCQVWAGFERLSRVRKARSRYEALAQNGARVVIVGAPDEPVQLPGAEIVAVAHGPLLAEWFLLVQSDRYSALISAVDLDGLRDDAWNKARRFQAFSTFDARVIEDTRQALERALLGSLEAPTRQLSKRPRRAM